MRVFNTCPNSFITCVKPSPLFPNFKPSLILTILILSYMEDDKALRSVRIDLRSLFFQRSLYQNKVIFYNKLLRPPQQRSRHQDREVLLIFLSNNVSYTIGVRSG